MTSYGLKANITVQIALILFFGMGLTAFMTTNVIEHLLVKTHVEEARILMTALQNTVNRDLFHQEGAGKDLLIRKLLNEQEGICILVFDPVSGQTYSYGRECGDSTPLKRYANKAIREKRYIEKSYGQVWGVFWKQKMSVIISAPVDLDRDKSLGLALMVSLNPVYKGVRHAQKLIFLYILINGVLLTLAGVYQVSKTAVKPVQRLLKRAEEYQGENKSLIFDEKGGNEFNRLSTALNNMLGRISDDKAKLSETVVSLEKTNRELKQAQADIIRAEKLASVGRLSSGIAHEIGNPLGIISGYLELIKSSDMDEANRQDFIRRAESELDRIDRIIRQLLDYSRTSQPSMAYFSVHETMADVAEMLRIQPVMSGTELEMDLNAKKDRIKGDEDQFRQVLMNLSLNALDAIALRSDIDTGRIRFETENIPAGEFQDDEGPLLHICVVDNGVGIPKESVDTIFDPFFTTKEPGKGTGLGLSVCFTIIQDLGGRIMVDSEPEKETRMNMYFPLPQSVKTFP